MHIYFQNQNLSAIVSATKQYEHPLSQRTDSRKQKLKHLKAGNTDGVEPVARTQVWLSAG